MMMEFSEIDLGMYSMRELTNNDPHTLLTSLKVQTLKDLQQVLDTFKTCL